MREGKFGWFCATKDASGEWCKEKAKTVPSAVPTQPSSTPVVDPVSFPKVRLAEAALAFAGNVFHGSGNPNEALAAAASAYNWLVNGTDADVNF
jgi:hypothetical protein